MVQKLYESPLVVHIGKLVLEKRHITKQDSHDKVLRLHGRYVHLFLSQ